jgi:iron complex outermembrane receptor protein
MNTQSNPKYRKNRLAQSLALALALPFAVSALAQTTEPTTTDSEEEETQLDEVIVTGSRIGRSEIEGPAPVVVLSAEDIEKQGYTTVYDALNSLTQFTGSVQNEFNQNGFTPNASFINLRGLGPGYSLILINGRRAADYPLPYNSESNAVNLGNIPAAAIERIEVLTGGASAIYGSDAVAGVVNIILKSNYSGDELSARIGTTDRGGGDQWRLQWVGGKTGDRWSLTYAAEALHRDALFASERDFMDSQFDDPTRPDADVNAVEGLLAFDAFNGRRLVPDANGDGIINDADREAVCNRFADFDPYYFETSGVFQGARCGYFGYPATQAIRNSDDNQSLYLSGTYNFTDNIEGYAQFFHTRANAKLASNVQFLGINEVLFIENLDSSALPFGAFTQGLQRIFTPGETGDYLQTKIKERSTDGAIGLRGTVFDGRFDWDAVLSHSRYTLKSDRPRFLEAPLFDFFLGQPTGNDPYFDYYDSYVLDLDRFYNPITPDEFASLNTIVKDEAHSRVTQGSFVLSGDLMDMPAGPLGFAGVLEFASQSYEVNPDERTQPNYTGPERIYNLTSTGGGGDRDRWAVGVEFSIPIVETLKASLAGRYDRYSWDAPVEVLPPTTPATFTDENFSPGAFTWQAGLEWRPTQKLLLRASHGTSFKAPDMHYIFAGDSGFFTGIFDEYACRRDGFDPSQTPNPCTGPDYQYTSFGIRHGDPNLEPEKGDSTTIGFVFDPIENMSVSVDWWDVELRNAVSDIASSEILRNEADCLLGMDRDGNAVDPNSQSCLFWTSLVDRDFSQFGEERVQQIESFPINQSLTHTRGIDASFSYELETNRLGKFNLGLGWTHVLEHEYQQLLTDDIEDIRDNKQFFDFRSRMTGTVVWEKDDWTTGVFMTRWGSLPNWAETDRIAPHFLWNLNVAKRFNDKAEVTLFVNNVFDKIHPRDDTFDSWPFFWRAYSPIGREFYVQFDYKFN